MRTDLPRSVWRRVGRSCEYVAYSLLALFGCNSTSEPPSGAFTVLWHTTTAATDEDYWLGRPAVDAGRVFVEDGNTVLALDVATGAKLWARPVRVHPFPAAAALLARDGRVYISETDSVLAMSESDGHTIWSFHPDSQAVAIPAMDQSTLYTGQRGLPIVYALSLADGSLRWKTNLGIGYHFRAYIRGITISGDTAYVAFNRDLVENGAQQSGVLVALDRSDGHELWRYETPGTLHSFVAEPQIVGRIAVLDDLFGMRLLGYDILAQREAWTVDMSPADPGRTIAVGSVVYVAGADGYAYAVDAATGTVRWKQRIGTSALNGGYCSGKFYANNEQLKRFDAATGTPEGTFSTNDVLTSGVASDGERIFVTGDHGVYALTC